MVCTSCRKKDNLSHSRSLKDFVIKDSLGNSFAVLFDTSNRVSCIKQLSKPFDCFSFTRNKITGSETILSTKWGKMNILYMQDASTVKKIILNNNCFVEFIYDEVGNLAQYNDPCSILVFTQNYFDELNYFLGKVDSLKKAGSPMP